MKALVDVPIADVIDYIDWNPFFQVWQLRGRYPNRGYPKIFNDETVGAEAKKLYEEAQRMLKSIMDNKRLKLNGIIGFYPANSVGDDIEVYADESRTTRRTLSTPSASRLRRTWTSPTWRSPTLSLPRTAA